MTSSVSFVGTAGGKQLGYPGLVLGHRDNARRHWKLMLQWEHGLIINDTVGSTVHCNPEHVEETSNSALP